MALRDETPINVHRNLSYKLSLPFFKKSRSTSRFRKPEILIVQNLGDRERVMNLSNIDIVWTTPAIWYAAFAAFFVTSKLVNGPVRPARDIGLEARPSPATHTGLSVSFLAFSAFAMMRHAAPSAFAQQSKSFNGADTGRDLRTSSVVMGF